MIQVTVEGAESSGNKEPAVKRGVDSEDTPKGIDVVDVAVVDKSGKTTVETVELNRLQDDEEAALLGDYEEGSQSSSGLGSPYKITPASHSREVHMSTSHEGLQRDGEVRNDQISYESTL